MKKTIYSLVLPILIIFVWAILTTFTGYIPEYILPSPNEVFQSFFELIYNGILLEATLYTLTQVFFGLIVSAAVAIPLGILMGWSAKVEGLLKLIVGILRPIPPIAWIPFAILWLGIGLTSSIFIIFLGSVFPILINTIDGVKRIDPVLTEVAYTLGATEFQTIRKVVMPAALPSIITGLKIGVGIGLMCTVAAEMIGSNNGLGYIIVKYETFLTNEVNNQYS
ncbi:MAG: ABC transporter permease [Methanobacteriaceae archaeon]|nr:ABC transporter permease [Methanobacteriaceae archaeon]